MLKLNEGKGRPGKANITALQLNGHGLLNQHCNYLKALARGVCALLVNSSYIIVTNSTTYIVSGYTGDQRRMCSQVQ